jgi:bifunctional non-homologous end joining protein LigD
VFEQACRQGLEGIMVKRADATYEARRTRSWLKVKCLKCQEFVIGGYTDPGGGRTGFGALLLSPGRRRFALRRPDRHRVR